jgi:hypothetical protein
LAILERLAAPSAAAYGGFQQVGGGAQALVVFGLGQQPREQVPDPGGRGPQPVVFVVVTQQHLGDRQADQLGVGDGDWAARAAGTPPWPQRGDDPIGQLHVQCHEKSVQVGDHEGLHGSDVCEHADPGHSSSFLHPLPPPAHQSASTI